MLRLRRQRGEASYRNCTAVREAGAAPIRRGDPGVGSPLYRDGDCVALRVTRPRRNPVEAREQESGGESRALRPESVGFSGLAQPERLRWAPHRVQAVRARRGAPACWGFG
ncbi:excalibur calcium-binding domain-containing protein [Streptomyces goshikiensis]|uniref:excalibur calcium-binding domain-containing protein n=1 Tax=Streptomyces goshikiensis TaxID=1942 RepID=UPI0037222504